MERRGINATMSEYHALMRFTKEPVSLEMIHFLASTTASIISINDTRAHGGPVVGLVDFIKGLVRHSNVQTPTLMATTVYLTKLRSIIPTDVYGMETTRHRIFLGCLILAAKNLNDSSPLNKHWAKYTDGLLDINDVNTIERELLQNFNWELNFTMSELVTSLSYFLVPIQRHLARRAEANSVLHKSPAGFSSSKYFVAEDSHSRSSSHVSIPSLSSTNTISTLGSTMSGSSSSSNHYGLNVIKEEPVQEKKHTLAKPIILHSKSYLDLKMTSICNLQTKEGLMNQRELPYTVEFGNAIL